MLLSDPSIGQKVKTVSAKPLALRDVAALLAEHLGFEDVCRQAGRSVATFSTEDGAKTLLVTGFDGHRRVPIRDDVGLVEFFGSVGFTLIPSLEVKLPRQAVQPAGQTAKPRSVVPVADGAASCRMASDKVEQLEDANFKLLRASGKLERRIDELERVVTANKEEARRQVDLAAKQQAASQDQMHKALSAEIARLDAKDKSILDDLQVVRLHAKSVEKQDHDHHEEMLQRLKETKEQVEEQFKEVDEQVQDLRQTDDMLQKEDEKQQNQLNDLFAETKRLDGAKVEQSVWKAAEDAMAGRISQAITDLTTHINTVNEELNIQVAEARRVQKQDHGQLTETVEANRKRSTEEEGRIEAKSDAAHEAAAKRITAVREEALAFAQKKVDELAKSTQETFDVVKQDIVNRDAKLHNRVDTLTTMCETTFKAIDERTEETLRVHRGRFGQVEKDLTDITTKLRADCRLEIERVRLDYEQEAARLDADLGDVHVKHDVTKQELTFVQSEVIELREWCKRQLAETATATRAVQVDSQEGMAASTKMLHALRDDAVSFREKMAKYISLLQHSSDSQGDAITAIEGHRGKIRYDLDALIADHKGYTIDMDSWADDVRVKVERIFRAMEPARVEWRICRAHKRAKDLKRPLGVKSATFSLRALREVQLEFFPDGTHTSPDGKAILRIYLPKGAHVRYQMWVGKLTEGPLEIKPGASLSADMLLEDWRNQILEDGTLPIYMEVLRDLANDDESLAREVRIESP